MQGSRSNAVLAVCQRGNHILSLRQSYFDINFNRESVPQLQALLKLPNEDGYALFAPVLFQDGQYDPNLKKLFKSIVLVKVSCICMLFNMSLTPYHRSQK